MGDEARRARAEPRSRTMTLRKVRLGEPDHDPSPLFGADAISMATQLTVSCWELSGLEMPRIPRDEMPFRFVARARHSIDNAERVYRALAAFGAPLHAFDVTVEDFASYDGVLQIGVPPRRIDVIVRADGISFDEAVAAGDSFAIEGRRVPVIGRAALLANEKASGGAQDLADVEALRRIADR